MSFFVSHTPVITYGRAIDSTAVYQVLVAPFRNTKEIIIYNPDPDHRLFVRIMDPANLTGVAANDLSLYGLLAQPVGTAALLVPTQSSISLAIGPEGERGPFELTGSPLYTSQISMYFRSETSPGPLDHYIQYTYVQCRGDLGR